MINALLSQSFLDFSDDFDELKYLATSQLEKVFLKEKQLLKVKSTLPTESYQSSRIDLHHFSQWYTNILQRIAKNKNLSVHAKNESDYSDLFSEKNALYDLLRTQQGLCAAVLAQTDWQSPSFLHSHDSQAGSQTGKIEANINDYKRDVHIDARFFEDAYKKEYINARLKLTIYPYLVNSGMAAFTTILNFLLGENKMDGSVLVGKSSYFQYKLILTKIFGIKCILVDENDAKSIIDAIKKYQPSVIFLDILGNNPILSIPNLPEIIRALVQLIKKETFLILDTTCTSLGFQPWDLVWGKSKYLRLITFESLNKYHQFGMDRVTAGIINVMGIDLGKMFYYRRDCGTIISDASVHALPQPRRVCLQKRLDRLQRNAKYIASALNELRVSKRSIIESVHYPSLKSHQSSEWASFLSYKGCLITLSFQNKYQNIKAYKSIIKKIVSLAKKENVHLIAGTSFGLNTTRIYHVYSKDSFITPFFRIAIGTEDRITIEKLKIILNKSFEY